MQPTSLSSSSYPSALFQHCHYQFSAHSTTCWTLQAHPCPSAHPKTHRFYLGARAGVGIFPAPKPKFTVYPSQNAQDTLIYQDFKYHSMSVTTNGDFESATASPTESIDNTAPMRDADTPLGMMMGGIELSSLAHQTSQPDFEKDELDW
ncbi:hypothetical protein EST38_g4649 [Candolleomyces aberdarensis]|uniref:Uncharacterized protein n=1 Tax=Candolleomyces aberdarensis TaxID=2316362 RepID=A0A4Q2DPU8_9AGAR|nr:hypothetical protein EST38_g4649 [Candolleomyces aberdarensis]